MNNSLYNSVLYVNLEQLRRNVRTLLGELEGKALIPVLIPLFVSSFRRAYELATAMECRCYHGGKGRTRMKQLHLAARDVWTLLAGALLIALLILGNVFLPASL